jgi:Lipocalin-like domain
MQRVGVSNEPMEDKMNRHAMVIRLAVTLLFLAGALPVGSASAQAKSIKDQVVGVWALVSWESFSPAGTKVPALEGGNVKGRLVLTDNGLLSVQIISEFPKLASKNRLRTTAAENKAIAHGLISFFGTYTVSEADKTLYFRIERSSFPNQVRGKDAKRPFTIMGDELRFINPGRSAGGNAAFVWKRIR